MPTAATCPFCGLLCDDLLVESEGDTLRPLRGACERSRAAFASLGTLAAATASSRVNGTIVSTSTALDAAAEILRGARRPLIGGLAIDIEGMRAALTLARRLGAVMDHAVSPVKYRNLHVLQEAGWITTTLAEVKNRTDLLMLIGDGWHTRFPRFVERLIEPDTLLFGSALARRIILLDQSAAAAAATLPQRCERLALGAPLAMLPALLAMLSALAANQPVDTARLAGIDSARLEQCVEWMRAARYGTVVWAAPDLEIAHAELALQMLSRLLRTLNRDGRFAALPLAGTNGDLSANAVHTWQSGVAFPASHANGRVDFDPHRYAAHAVLARGEADCVVWISSLSAELAPPPGETPTIVLGRADMQLATAPRVFVPVATPGVDAAGSLMRTDKTVSLHLRRLRESALLSVAQAMQALLHRLEVR
jgi:formylmethanofuran dehydrogenase subunit B